MAEIPFHATREGRRFYGHTVPELARQLMRLNETLERLVAALPPPPNAAVAAPPADDPDAADDAALPDPEPRGEMP